ncbi:MAG: bifunctional aspartate kinase/homoserine dehydrogenase I [Bacteroidetes bacterium]|nr:bifunctional aspartate kinase/homoserine dehydrogenase I [Bacteroidota bacterium]
MKVLKFGGSCIRSAKDIRNLSTIISNYPRKEKLAIVVSAFQGITDQLEQCGNLAVNKGTGYQKAINAIESLHLTVIDELFPVTDQSPVKAEVKVMINEVEDLCTGISFLEEFSPKTKDALIQYGELLSACIIYSYLKKDESDSIYVDAREVILTDENFGNANVNLELSYHKIRERFTGVKSIVIVPGFIASADTGQTTTLGREGSDYTAAIIATAVNALSLDKWTNVDGIMTADPIMVKNALPIKSLSYNEAMELAHFGAKVIYPPTLHTIIEKGIPIYIRNVFSPQKPGTKICLEKAKNGVNVKGLSSIKNIALITVSGSGMVGVPGISMRLFGALAGKMINIIFITQASSEHSITIGFNQTDIEIASETISNEFSIEIQIGKVNELEIEKDLSIVAIVGDKMKKSVGLAGKAFNSLGKNGVNIRSIAQGSSERNISMVIRRDDLKKALNTLHESFFLSETKRVHLFLTGTGNVGSALLSQIHEQSEYLKKKHTIELKLIGIANSKKMYFDIAGIDTGSWNKELNNNGEKTDPAKFLNKARKLNLRNSIFIDETADERITKLYQGFLEASISVVTSNKIASSSEFEYYKLLQETARKKNTKFLYETNVGAGLPIIKTIHDLIDSGDRIIKLQAVLSGSLNYIFNSFNENTSFSEVVKIAHEKGYTEPDPGIDLSGTDVMRKLLILARECGSQMELDAIKCEPFLPEVCLKSKTTEEFYSKLADQNEYFERLRKKTLLKNKKLRFIAEWESGKGSVGLSSIGPDHPFYNLDGKDNIIVIYTDRYKKQPLVIKGAGAGAEVTASGVFADIMRISVQ